MYAIKYRDDSEFITCEKTCFNYIPSNWKLSKLKFISIMKTGNSSNAASQVQNLV